MYSKDELKQLNIHFWEKFGRSSDSIAIHRVQHKSKKWMLHRTKIKDVALRFEANREDAKVIPELSSNSEKLRFKAYEFMERYKVVLEEKQPGVHRLLCHLHSS